MEELDDGIETRCVIITGSEGCSPPATTSATSRRGVRRGGRALVAHPFSRAIEAVERFPFPTLAAINGHALGGGLELAVTCDLRWPRRAKLGMPPGKLGLIYSHTGIQKFLDTVGPARTRELFFTGRNVTPSAPSRSGSCTRPCPRTRLEQHAVELAAEIAGQRPALPERKQADHQGPVDVSAPIRESLSARWIDLRLSSFRTEDFREGVRAFGEKRKPRWQGARRTAPPVRTTERTSMENSAIVAATDLHKYFGHGETAVHALDGVTVSFSAASTPRSWARPARASRR